MSACMNCTAAKPGTGRTIQCDGCKGNIHISCGGLTDNDIVFTRSKSRSLKIVCNVCNNNMAQFGNLKALINNLKDEFANSLRELKLQFDDKIKEIKLNNLNNDYKLSESLIQEINERQKRANNVIVFNLEEVNSTHPDQQEVNDKNQVKNILKSIPSIDLNNLRVTRLGAQKPTNKPRPLRVTLADHSQVLQVLKNKQTLITTNNKLKFKSDETPRQREYMKSLQSELLAKQENGQDNLTIKYVRGIPTIVPKNQ